MFAAEDSFLEMEYEDRFRSDMDDDDGPWEEPLSKYNSEEEEFLECDDCGRTDGTHNYAIEH